jgi:hypothetical protein
MHPYLQLKPMQARYGHELHRKLSHLRGISSFR